LDHFISKLKHLPIHCPVFLRVAHIPKAEQGDTKGYENQPCAQGLSGSQRQAIELSCTGQAASVPDFAAGVSNCFLNFKTSVSQ
jgi:hypothetical protein